MNKKLQILTWFLMVLPALLIAQHTISGTFSPADDYNYALLYKVTPDGSIYVSNSEITQGEFEFKLDSTVTKGIYRLVYALPQEENNFDIIYNAAEDVELTFNQEVGVSYIKSDENKLMNSYSSNMSAISQSIGEYFRSGSSDTLVLKNLFQSQKDIQTDFEKQSEGTIAGSFIKGSRPYIPENYENVQTYIANLKSNYFVNFNFNDEILQSSDFLIDRVLSYVFGMTNKDLDTNSTYKANIDEVIKAMANSNLDIRKLIFTDLWQQMVDLGIDEVANYISDSCLIDIATKSDDKQLVFELEQFRNLSIGKIAPDFSFEETYGDITTKAKLSELDVAENYIIVFWSSACHHCLEEIPQLHQFLEKQDDIKVIAIGLEDNSDNWLDVITNYSEFTHVLGLGKWTNKLGRLYNVSATPTYFVLDKNKTIIAKPDDIVALKQYFETQK